MSHEPGNLTRNPVLGQEPDLDQVVNVGQELNLGQEPDADKEPDVDQEPDLSQKPDLGQDGAEPRTGECDQEPGSGSGIRSGASVGRRVRNLI